MYASFETCIFIFTETSKCDKKRGFLSIVFGAVCSVNSNFQQTKTQSSVSVQSHVKNR